MTSTHPHTLSTPCGVDLGETRSRFLLARAQTAAHVSTAQYHQMREMGLLTPSPRTSTGRSAQRATRATRLI
jgi:hypothetical protein